MKGHYRRFFAIWAILVGFLVLIVGGGQLLSPPEGALRGWIPAAAVVAFGFLWSYQLWDAVTRPK